MGVGVLRGGGGVPTSAPAAVGAARAATGATPAISVEGLSKRFGAVEAVRELSLTVGRGKVFGFLGPNGAGKTTTIGMLLGLVHPTAGHVRVLGDRVAPGRPAALRRVGALVGAPALVPGLSALDNVTLVARLGGLRDRRRILQVLERVGLAEAARRRSGTFSTGMKQRLGLAMALVERPELLVLDEPTSGMDAAGRRDVKNLLRELAGEGVTVFLSSHLLNEVEQVCDEVAVLDRGRLVAVGPVAALQDGRQVVRVRVDDPKAALRALRDLPGVARAAESGSVLEVEGVDSRVVNEHLVRLGYVPSELSCGGADLESLFLSLTEHGEGAEA